MADDDINRLISTENEQQLGRSPGTDTVTLTNQSTEYTYSVPSGTKILVIKTRTIEFDIVYGWATGALNITVNAGERRVIDRINLVDKTLYLQCNQAAGVVVEIEYFQ